MEVTMIGAIIQARCESIRFPNKILTKINNKTIIELLIERIEKSKFLDKIIVATSTHKANTKLINILKERNIDYFIGSQKNVLSRYYETAKKFKLKTIIRLTGDNPLVDNNIIDDFIQEFKSYNYDYLSDSVPPTYPDGIDVEIFKFKALKKEFLKKRSSFENEHVTPGIKNNKKNKIGKKKLKENFSFLRLTLDEQNDYKCINKIFRHFHPRINFTLNDITQLYKKKPNIFKTNMSIKRDEGSQMTTGNKMWKRALKSLPNGNMFFSKNPNLTLPELWPTYYSKAKGYKIWDLDNKLLNDFYLMGVGTNLLGYANKEIDNSVIKNIQKSNMSSLNSVEEILLAEKLINLHPWSSYATFARTGGEANSMAIRIGRAYANKGKIAICGYHGWHDWYLAANLKDPKKLDQHLLSGLKTNGVAKNLSGSTLSFNYNDFYSFEKIIKNNNDLGIVIMEVMRNEPPKDNFLDKIRDICNRKKIVLIFDECSSGFRENFGGLHLNYNVNPDICMFGKALGNGYAITSLVGKEKIMKKARESFISSTFWSERIGYTAALKTLEIMERIKSWEKVSKLGSDIKKIWRTLSKSYELDINIAGLNAIPNFSFNSKNHLKYKTYITQEMLKHKILASNVVYMSVAHDQKIIKNYKDKITKIFAKIKDCENGKSIDKLLKTKVCQSTFKRLN